MLLLDTNVVSELMRPAADRAVPRWLAAQPQAGIYICAITEAELRVGVALLPEGRRRDALAADVEAMVAEDFGGRTLPFDSAASAEYAKIVAARRRAGRPIAVFDAQIAAIARSRGASLATRNVADFEGTGIVVINPWTRGA